MNGSSCVTHYSKRLSSLDTNPEHYTRRSVTPIPQEMKIHPSVTKLFENKQMKVEADQFLQIEFGLGAKKGLKGIDMARAVRGWISRSEYPHFSFALVILFMFWPTDTCLWTLLRCSATGRMFEPPMAKCPPVMLAISPF